MSQVEEFVGKFKLSNSQLKVVRDIFLEVGLLFLASWAIVPLAGQNYRRWQIISGLLTPIFLWYSCIKLTSYFDNDE
jgi:hypothetical protein